jgi:glycosyltransferase involved in cell wall biosynthesis
MSGPSDYVAGKVSVVIPCYNRASYVGEAVDSVLDQTYENLEVIVVDDGSTDDSLAVVRSYGDRVKVLQHPGGVNRGQSAAINLGVAHADGEYVAILDSDDYWALDKLEKQVAVLQADPAIGLVYGNARVVDAYGNLLYTRYGEYHEERNEPGRILVDCYFSVPSNALIRHAVLDAVGGFNEELRAAQDHDMAIRIAEATRLAYIPDVMFQYRRHGDSISAGRAGLRWRNGFKILEAARRRFDYPAAVIRRRRALLHFRVGQCLLRERRFLRAVPHFLGAFFNDPGRSLRVLLGGEKISAPTC